MIESTVIERLSIGRQLFSQTDLYKNNNIKVRKALDQGLRFSALIVLLVIFTMIYDDHLDQILEGTGIPRTGRFQFEKLEI